MRFLQPFLLGFALMACTGDTTKDATDGLTTDGDADTDIDTDTDTDVACDASIASTNPPNAAVGVPADSDVTVSFTTAIDPASPWSLDITNAAGASTLASDGLSATWVGSLAPDTQYTLSASVCDDDVTTTFHTSPPPLDLLTLEGNTYALPWDSVLITEPTYGEVLKTLIGIEFVLAQISTVDLGAQTADAFATIGNDDGAGNASPVCSLAVETTADFTQNPYFSINGTLTLVVDAGTGATADVEDFSILALVAPNGDSISNVQLSGLVATEQFLEGIDCHNPTIQALGATCVPCSISGTNECMLLEGTAPLANRQVGLDIESECGLGTTTTTPTGTSTTATSP